MCRMQVASNVPVLRAIQVHRTTTSGSVSDSLMAALLKHCEVRVMSMGQHTHCWQTDTIWLSGSGKLLPFMFHYGTRAVPHSSSVVREQAFRGCPGVCVCICVVFKLQVEGVYKLKGCEGFGNWWAAIEPAVWKSVRSLNLSYCGLAVLPPAIGGLGATLKVCC